MLCSPLLRQLPLECSLKNRLSVLVQQDLGLLQQLNTGIQLGEEFLDLVDDTVLLGEGWEGEFELVDDYLSYDSAVSTYLFFSSSSRHFRMYQKRILCSTVILIGRIAHTAWITDGIDARGFYACQLLLRTLPQTMALLGIAFALEFSTLHG